MAVAVSTRTKRLTFEEWLSLPETKQRYEIVDGVMSMPPGPSVDHQWISHEIDSMLTAFARATGLGVVLSAPLDLMVQREPLRIRQADIVFLNAQRTGIRRRSDVIGRAFLEVPPDVAVEVLSPSNTRREMDAKMRDYQRIGMYQWWIFSPEAETAEVIDLTGSAARTLAILGVEDTLTSDLLPGFGLHLREVFR